MKLNKKRNEAFKRAFLRFIRACVSVVIAGLASRYANNEIYLVLAPILLAIDKYVRDKN